MHDARWETVLTSVRNQSREKCNYSSGSQQFSERWMYTVRTISRKGLGSTKGITNHHRELHYCSAFLQGHLEGLGFVATQTLRGLTNFALFAMTTVIISSRFGASGGSGIRFYYLPSQLPSRLAVAVLVEGLYYVSHPWWLIDCVWPGLTAYSRQSILLCFPYLFTVRSLSWHANKLLRIGTRPKLVSPPLKNMFPHCLVLVCPWFVFWTFHLQISTHDN